MTETQTLTPQQRRAAAIGTKPWGPGWEATFGGITYQVVGEGPRASTVWAVDGNGGSILVQKPTKRHDAFMCIDPEGRVTSTYEDDHSWGK